MFVKQSTACISKRFQVIGDTQGTQQQWQQKLSCPVSSVLWLHECHGVTGQCTGQSWSHRTVSLSHSVQDSVWLSRDSHGSHRTVYRTLLTGQDSFCCHCFSSYLQWGFHADLGLPPYTASSQTRHPRKCPQGSAHPCEGGKAVYQASGPKNKLKYHFSCDCFKKSIQ